MASLQTLYFILGFIGLINKPL